MLKKILMIACIAALTFSCSKKKKPEEVLPDAPQASEKVDDGKIQSKDLNMDMAGSDSGKIDGLYTLHYEYDKAILTSESKRLAQKNADWLKAHPGSKVQIEGHCDQHGSTEYNLALGERRAKAARSYMVNLGTAENRISVISYGKERPLETGTSESADQKNRRANFVPLGS